jgi:tetratricopeptide (TPR) repeat protein
MGVIYRAHDLLREQDVAFKRLVVAREPMRAHMTALFEREFHTLAQLSHPGIVEAYDYGIDAEGPYYTMELLTGHDLRRGMPLPLERACRLLCEVASGLALLHARRLVHRDLSPANVLLTSSGHAKLIDFGALCAFGRPKQIVGTPAFIAPECLLQHEIDQRVDLYALGALAYWVLTGTHAVQASSMGDLPPALARPIARPSQRAAGLPKAMDELVLSLLQHDPLARPANAAYVIDRLAAIASQPLAEDTQRVSMSYVAHPPLVGRDDELGQLAELLRDSAQGHGHTVWVEAAQGAGRSALLDRLALDAQLTGATVLRAQGGVRGSALSLAARLVSSAVRTHPDLRRFCEEQHPRMVAFCLAGAAEQGGRPQGAQTPGSAAEGYAELMAGMHDCLLELSRMNPLVLVLDDVDAADAESVGLLASLAHAAPGNSLLLVVSAVSDARSARPPALARLYELAHRITLTTLDEAHVAELVSALFGAVPNATRLARWLHAQGEGHPQRSMDLLRLLLQRGVVGYQAGLFSLPFDVDRELGAFELGGVPWARLEVLDDDARRVAQLLSIEEQALDLQVLPAAVGLRGQRFFAAVEALFAQGIAVKLDGRVTLASRPLRSAAAGMLSVEQRCELNLKLAHALLEGRRSIDDVIMAGFHLLRGGRRDEGAETLAAASDQITLSAEGIAKAAPALEQALEVYRAQGRPDMACLRLLVPLTVAGFYDPRLSARYFERTYRAMLHVSGAALAQRLTRFVGARLGLLLGLLYGFFLFLRMPLAQRTPRFRRVLDALFGVASAGTAAMASAYEQEQTLRIVERLAPFAALGTGSIAFAVRELCQGLCEIMLSKQASVAERMRRLMDLLADGRALRGLHPDVRVQMRLGAVYLRGVSEVYAGSPQVLELAAELDESGRAFSKPRAALLRMCHHGFRGDQELADKERTRAEALALLGGTSWSAMSAMAIRRLLLYQWTRDSVGLLRVVHELRDLTIIAPALQPHCQLGEAYLELLRGRPERALEVYERLLDAPRAYPVVNWQPEAAHRAQALNALGRHAEAREVCLAVVTRTSAEDLRMRFLYQPAQQELAISEASLGRAPEAEQRLDRLIEEVRPLSNPLLSGCVHRDRARVALLAEDATGFARHLAAAGEYLQATRNPCLIQQCEALAAQGVSAGMFGAGRRVARLQGAGESGDARALTTLVEGNGRPARPDTFRSRTTLAEEGGPRAHDVRSLAPPAANGASSEDGRRAPSEVPRAASERARAR